MENRMVHRFAKNKANGKGSLVLYFPVGDTILDNDVAWAKRYFSNGCDVLEIGLPYEAPVLDGTTVRQSMERALSHRTLDDIFASIKSIRQACPDNVLQIMTYYGNISKYGISRFAEICHDCDVDGVLTPDAPQEKMLELDRELGKYDICNLRFSYYTLTDELIADLKQNSRGYVFQQAVNGGTGPQETVDPQVGVNLSKLREAGITTPLFAGFGINYPEQAAQILSLGAEGVIVGSATISHIAKGDGEAYIKSLSDAMYK